MILGNLTRDPELRYTPDGSPIAAIGVAVNRRYKDKSGADKEEVTFIDATAFTRTAELLAQYYGKGSPILFEGRLKTDSWEEKETKAKRTKLVVIVEALHFLPKGRDNQSSSPPPPPPAPKPAAPPPATEEPPDPDDVPF